MNLYKTEKKDTEKFAHWTDRVGELYLKDQIQEFTSVEPMKSDPKMHEDLGDEGKDFKVEVGKGECAA